MRPERAGVEARSQARQTCLLVNDNPFQRSRGFFLTFPSSRDMGDRRGTHEIVVCGSVPFCMTGYIQSCSSEYNLFVRRPDRRRTSLNDSAGSCNGMPPHNPCCAAARWHKHTACRTVSVAIAFYTDCEPLVARARTAPASRLFSFPAHSGACTMSTHVLAHLKQ